MAKKIRAYNGSFLSLTGVSATSKYRTLTSVRRHPLRVNGTGFGKSINVHWR